MGDGPRRRALARHLSVCGACARYDASLRQGVQELRIAVDEIEPSAGFRERLRARIAAGAQPAEPVNSGAAGLAALLMVATAVSLLVAGTRTLNQPSQTAQQPQQSSPPAQVEPARPMVVVNPGVPFVVFTDLSVPAFDRPAFGIQSSPPGEQTLGNWANLPR